MVAHLYHITQQKHRYEIVKNRSRNTQKLLYVDLKIANFIQRQGASPSGLNILRQLGVLPSDSRLSQLFQTRPSFSISCARYW